MCNGESKSFVWGRGCNTTLYRLIRRKNCQFFHLSYTPSPSFYNGRHFSETIKRQSDTRAKQGRNFEKIGVFRTKIALWEYEFMLVSPCYWHNLSLFFSRYQFFVNFVNFLQFTSFLTTFTVEEGLMPPLSSTQWHSCIKQ